MLAVERTLRTFCTGGDLFGVGAVQAGYRVVGGFEIDPKKAAVACRNGHPVHVADVTRLAFGLLAPVWHEHWSPSCKTASQANNQGGETPDDIAVAEACALSIAAHAARGGRTWSLENVWGYRTFDSFAIILYALQRAGFIYEYRHINMADFGVPQTRKRLILWAVHRSWADRVPQLQPTHCRGGDLLHQSWVGWYAAIADLIPTLPETTPVRWQQQRMGRLPVITTLIGAGGWEGGIVQRGADEPAFTLAHGGDPNSTGNSAQIRAYLVSGENAGSEWGGGFSEAAAPAQTVSAASKGAPRAYLVVGGNTNLADPTSAASSWDQPAFTVRNGQHGSPERALLLGDQSGHAGTGVILRDQDDPAMTVRAGRKETCRAYNQGRWVKITLACLARWQTVPDDYRGLTAEINGNGVPPRFARNLMEALTL